MSAAPNLDISNDVTQDVVILDEEFSQQALATPSQRVIAILLDGFFSGVLKQLFVAFFHFAFHLEVAKFGPMATFLISFNIFMLYWCAPVYFNGQTLGKKILGLRVVPENFTEFLGFWQIVGRESIGRLLSTLPLFYGYIRAFRHPECKTWHDQLFKTRVIDLRKTKA